MIMSLELGYKNYDDNMNKTLKKISIIWKYRLYMLLNY